MTRDERLVYLKRWKQRNRAHVLAYNREYMREYREHYRAEWNEYRREWARNRRWAAFADHAKGD